LGGAGGAGVTVLCLVEDRANEPAQTELRIELAGQQLTVQETAPGGRRFGGIPDQIGPAFCEAIARSLAPLRLEPRGGVVPLPPRVRLLDLLGIGLGGVDPARTW